MTSFSSLKSLFRPQFLVVLTFASLLVFSWHRWTTLIIDNGREVDLPFRLMNGEVLYRDVHYLYTPFSPYFNALLYRVFGAHLDTLAFSGIFFSALVVLLCYLIFRKLMPAAEAAIGTCFVITLCVLKPAGNMVLPYSFGALHALVFSLVSVLFTQRYAERRKKIDLVVAGLFIGMAVIAKQEFGLASAITVTLYLVFLNRSNFKKLIVEFAVVSIPAFIIALPVFAVLFINLDSDMLIKDCHLFYTNIPPEVAFYNRFRSGMNYPVGSFIQMIGAAAFCTAFTTAIIMVSDRTGRLRRKVVPLLAISSIITAIVLYFYIDQWDGSPLRALPFFLLATLAITWRRASRAASAKADSADDQPNGPLFIAAVFALLILARVILRVPSGGFAGNFFLPLSLGLIVYALLWELPIYIRKWTDDVDSFDRARTITRTLCIVSIGVMVISFGYRYRTRFVYPVTAERGTAIIDKESGPVIDATLRFIEANTAPNEYIGVIPEGDDLAFLVGRRINVRHQNMLPGFMNENDELAAIEALKRGNVRYIFMPNRAMREFGVVAFGRDYYHTLGNWIEDNYQVVKVFGVADGQIAEIGKPPYFIKVYERKTP